jgi:hypothetical protein
LSTGVGPNRKLFRFGVQQQVGATHSPKQHASACQAFGF